MPAENDANNSPPANVNSSDGHEDRDAQAVFADLYRRRGNDALRYATTILGAQDAPDACQEAWLRVWRAWASHDPDRLDAWAFRIVRNCCFDHQRARRPVEALDEADLPPVPAAQEDLAAELDAVAEVVPALRKLPPWMQEILWLREVMDMSYAEMAEVLDVPMGTVMSRLNSARKKAAAALRKEGW